MSAADDLRILVDAYKELVINLTGMVSRLDDELTSLNAEITTITDGVMGAAQTSHLARLEAKRVSLGANQVRTFGSYGTDNISDDWNIWDYNLTPWTADITRLGDNSFRIDGYTFPTYTTGTKLKFQPGDVERVIASQTILPAVPPVPGPAFPGYNIVTLTTPGTALPGSIISVDGSHAVYDYLGVGWDGDAGIIQDQDAYAIGYDQINAPIDINGTYGLLARISNITFGRGVQVRNRDKYQEFVDYYEPYATP